MTSTMAAILLQVCCDFVTDKPIFVLNSEKSKSSINKKNLHFLAKLVSEPGSLNPQSSALPLSYKSDDINEGFMSI